MINFNSSSIGSSNGEFCHQTEPLPSIVPLPLIVIPTSFVNSSHWRRPEPQAFESVGAMILPSSCTGSTNLKICTNPLIKHFKFSCCLLYSIIYRSEWLFWPCERRCKPCLCVVFESNGGQTSAVLVTAILHLCGYEDLCHVAYLKNNILFTVRSREWNGPHKEYIFWRDHHRWRLHLTSSSPGSLECLHLITGNTSSWSVNIFIAFLPLYALCQNHNFT